MYMLSILWKWLKLSRPQIESGAAKISKNTYSMCDENGLVKSNL